MSEPTLHHVHKGGGTPLLLIHGLGGSWRSWDPIIDALAAEREVIAIDLPGFGDSAPLPGEVSIATLADALEEFLRAHELVGVDVVGSSMGARLALELSRRGAVGASVALDPGGFWSDGERKFFGLTVGLSVKLIRLLQPLMPFLTSNPVTRTLLFIQFSARPWSLSSEVALTEMRSFAAARSLDAALDSLVNGPTQEGLARGEAKAPIVIGWGRSDRVCLPRQAKTAIERFPDARLAWFEDCGHFPQWDQPQQAVNVILSAGR